MLLHRFFYAAVILCFMIIHYVALQQIDAHASHALFTQHAISQPTD